MIRVLVCLTSVVMASGSVSAGGRMPENTDTFMVSRDANEKFLGSHRVFDRETTGLVNVEYCGRSYWVRPVTVAWTQLESEANRQVRIEWNWGKGWRPMCDNAEQEVTLEEIGIHLDADAVVASQGRIIGQANRFSAILKAFRQSGSSHTKASFHNK